MISTDLQTMAAAAATAFATAIAAAQAYETGTQTRQEKEALCDALQALKDLNDDENEAINEAMGLIGCGA